MKDKLRDFQEFIDYKFQNEALLAQALTTPQLGNELGTANYEFFETLGDAVIKVIFILKLYRKGITDPGKITKIKASLESDKTLKKVANIMNLQEYIFKTDTQRIKGTRILADMKITKTLRRIFQFLKENAWIITLIPVVTSFYIPQISQYVYAIDQSIFRSYGYQNMRVLEDSLRAGYQRAHVFFNEEVERFAVFFHIGGWGRPLWLYLLELFAPYTIGGCFLTGGMWVIRKWWIQRKKRQPIPYIAAYRSRSIQTA